MTRITIRGGEFAAAAAEARKRLTRIIDGQPVEADPHIDVKTRRVRVLNAVEKFTTNSGNRDFRRDKKRPKTIEWALKRTFVFAS